MTTRTQWSQFTWTGQKQIVSNIKSLSVEYYWSTVSCNGCALFVTDEENSAESSTVDESSTMGEETTFTEGLRFTLFFELNRGKRLFLMLGLLPSPTSVCNIRCTRLQWHIEENRLQNSVASLHWVNIRTQLRVYRGRQSISSLSGRKCFVVFEPIPMEMLHIIPVTNSSLTVSVQQMHFTQRTNKQTNKQTNKS